MNLSPLLNCTMVSFPENVLGTIFTNFKTAMGNKLHLLKTGQVFSLIKSHTCKQSNSHSSSGTGEITLGNRGTSTSMLETAVCLGFARNTGDILPLNQRLFLCAMSAPTLETVWSLNEVGIELTGKREVC